MVFLKMLLTMFENNGLLPIHQFGFRLRHSTINRHTESYMDNKQYSFAAFLDISQAFDKV
jgi:hypothetical protein